MRVADYIFKFLSDKGSDKVFMVSGGQAMWLVDAVAQNKKIETICTHHEQAAGMSADAYGRLTGKPGVALVTAGPGSINVVNGLVGGWTDSAPMFVISGQSNLSYVEYQEESGIRQYGVQGIFIRPFVESATKYFVTVNDPAKLEYYMEKAYYLATHGRPGPVWIDVPIDIQKMEVPSRFTKKFEIPTEDKLNATDTKRLVSKTLNLLSSAKRPILLVGQGIRLAGRAEEFNRIAEKLQIPVITSRLGIDLMESDNKLYVGRPGIYGERAANFAIQNSDLILSIGCRLATPLVGYNGKEFGKNAKKIVVDIDQKELDKPGITIDLKIKADIRDYFEELTKQLKNKIIDDHIEWVNKCNYWKENYPVVLDSYKDEKPVNSYYFTSILSSLAGKDDLIVLDTGSCFHVVCQSWKLKKGQRFLTTGGISTMGYWPASIGACIAHNRKETILITGDGSLQMNLQELATIKHNNLPIKIFIFNNNGYLLIRQTQRNFMDDRYLGEGPESGVWCPDSLKIAEAYGIKAVRIDSTKGIEEKIKSVLKMNGPVICDVMTPEWQLLIPRVASEKKPDGTLVSKPYDDMFPFLEREEYLANAISPNEKAK